MHATVEQILKNIVRLEQSESNIPFRKKRCRRFDRSIRACKKRNKLRKQIRSSSRIIEDTMNELDPINLSSINMEENQITLLRKGSSFCPTPKDINWQEVYDNYELFETRLRTAAYLMNKPIDTTSNSPNVSFFPKNCQA